jgi:hypothetical protein
MKILYSGWEGWLEKKGIEMTVEEDSEKTLHSDKWCVCVFLASGSKVGSCKA